MLMGARMVQIPAIKLQEYRFLRQETVCTAGPSKYPNALKSEMSCQPTCTYSSNQAFSAFLVLQNVFDSSRLYTETRSQVIVCSRLFEAQLKHFPQKIHTQVLQRKPTPLPPASRQMATKTLKKEKN